MNAKEKFSKDIKSATVVNVTVIKFNSLVADMERSFSFLDRLNQLCFINQSTIHTKSLFLNSVKAGGKLQRKTLKLVDWLRFKKRHHLIITKCTVKKQMLMQRLQQVIQKIYLRQLMVPKQIYNADKTVLY